MPVFEVCYFRFENPVGYVIHEPATRHYQTVLICVGPFIINSLLAFLIGFPAALQFKFDDASFIDYVLVYLGVSIGAHAFPSIGDAESLWQSVMNKETPIWVKILVAPVVGFIYLGALGSFFWLDLAFGIGLALGLPYLVLKFFA